MERCEVPVFIVEDDPSHLAAIKAIVKQWGYECLGFLNGEDAWDYIKELEVDFSFILTLDWMLPGMSGLELCILIRKFGHTDHAHVLCLSGNDTAQFETEAYEAGVDEYWQKPIPIERLKWRLDKACSRLQVLASKLEEWPGVLNRNATIDRLEEEVARVKRSRKPLTLMVFDIDHFKSINTKFPFAVATEIMRLLTGLVQSCIRQTDRIGRYGGDEFCILMPDCNKTKALEIAEKIRARVEKQGVLINDERVPLTISIGVAVSEKPRRKPKGKHSVLRADRFLAKALTNAKEAKKTRNKVVLN